MNSQRWTWILLSALVLLSACADDGEGGSTDNDTTNEGTGTESTSATDTESDTFTPASAEQLREFLGGKGGLLTWVDAGGRVKLLDLRQDASSPTLVSGETSCLNPILSPDGTRVVYSRGQANGPKQIFLRALAGGDPVLVANSGDLGYFAVAGGSEFVVYSDWSDKAANGADGKTYRRLLTTGAVAFAGEAEEVAGRAMDAGPNRDLTWLGQVYNNMYAHDVEGSVEYATEKFFLLDGTPASHQTCNGSMAPDTSARLMVLVIPHDWVRVFSYVETADRFEETSRFELPGGLVEWEFPEWSTSPSFFSAVLRAADRKNRLFLGKVEAGDVVPQLIEAVGADEGVSYGHLWVED